MICFIYCYERLFGIEIELPTSNFIQIHVLNKFIDSIIINYSKVDVFTLAYVQIGDKKLPIGRNYKDDVLKRLT